jgi:ribosomal protein S18 acetylase RimI-like enzyme
VTPIVRPLGDDDRGWVRDFIRDRWGHDTVVCHGVVFRPATLPGLVLIDDAGNRAGLLTYTIEADACEIVTIDAVAEGRGYGSRLLDEVSRIAIDAGCSRLSLITTNDNERAIGFYLAHGFDVVDVREGAIEESRKLKPSIPLVDDRGVPITDEIQMERRVSSGDGTLPS